MEVNYDINAVEEDLEYVRNANGELEIVSLQHILNGKDPDEPKKSNIYIDNNNNFLNIYICDGFKYIDVKTFNRVYYAGFIQDYKKVNDIIHNFKFINNSLYYRVTNEEIKVILSKYNMKVNVIGLKREEKSNNLDDKIIEYEKIAEYIDKYKEDNSIFKDMNNNDSNSKLNKF